MLGYIGKKMSTIIYIVHYIFVYIMWIFLVRTVNNDMLVYKDIMSYMSPILVSVLSIILAYFVNFIQNRRKIVL